MESKGLELLQSIFEQQKFLVERMREPDMAQLAVDKADRPLSIIKIELDLSKEQDALSPRRIGFPFKSMHFKSSTNPKSFINVKPSTLDEHQDSFELSYNDGWKAGKIVQDAFLSWPAQVGKGVLYIYTDSEFVSGSQLSITSGGVTISEGSSSELKNITLVSGASEVLPQNLFRKAATVVNDTGDDLFLGSDNTVNASTNKGVPLANGDSVKWRNTGHLYAYSASGGKIIILEET